MRGKREGERTACGRRAPLFLPGLGEGAVWQMGRAAMWVSARGGGRQFLRGARGRAGTGAGAGRGAVAARRAFFQRPGRRGCFGGRGHRIGRRVRVCGGRLAGKRASIPPPAGTGCALSLPADDGTIRPV
ncbi:hypothetical protein HMPREF0262_02960 [Clostridium sp. ATCC 29733]|nr:hypothetical protein HMPREF0262_02960 [Clostridium sp. ATCC 29733]